MSLGDVMIVNGGFWAWCLFAHQSHNKSSSKRSTFKAPSKGMELRILFAARMFGGFANRILNTVLNYTMLLMLVYQMSWNSILNAYFHRLKHLLSDRQDSFCNILSLNLRLLWQSLRIFRSFGSTSYKEYAAWRRLSSSTVKSVEILSQIFSSWAFSDTRL